jgi:hypothetical protein
VSYSPHLRTAVLLSGSGTAGAYHAGALRALHEAGIKIDVMSGRGIGVVGALFAAIDAASKTWEDEGLWRRRPPVRLYAWRSPLRWSTALVLLAVAILALPLIVLATGLVAYPLSFLAQMVSVDAGYRIAAGYTFLIARAFSPGGLPTIVPRLITLCLALAFMVLAAAAVSRSRRAASPSQRDPGRWWARLVGSPWTSEPGLNQVRESLWSVFRGPATAKAPPPADLSRRYADLLVENLGQPGFRELIVTALDLETRDDLVFAMLSHPRRLAFFRRAGGRGGDLVDLAGPGRSQVLDAVAAAVSLPVMTEPHLISFSPESYWKGETHRVCDRPAAVTRLLHELAMAGVEQVVVVAADAGRAAPHRLRLPVGSLESRLSEHLSAIETAAVRDAVNAYEGRFAGVFVIQPQHNPVGPFDYRGSYDERSDRYQSLGELMDRGYEDAYRQFIEPVVAS